MRFYLWLLQQSNRNNLCCGALTCAFKPVQSSVCCPEHRRHDNCIALLNSNCVCHASDPLADPGLQRFFFDTLSQLWPQKNVSLWSANNACRSSTSLNACTSTSCPATQKSRQCSLLTGKVTEEMMARGTAYGRVVAFTIGSFCSDGHRKSSDLASIQQILPSASKPAMPGLALHCRASTGRSCIFRKSITAAVASHVYRHSHLIERERPFTTC